MEHRVNHIQMIKDDDNIDNKMAVNNYLVQNIKQGEEIKSPEVQAIKRGKKNLEKQEIKEAELPSIKVNQAGTFMISAGSGEGEKYTQKTQKMDTSDRPGIPIMQQSVGQRKDQLASQVKNSTNTDHILKRILDVQVLVTVRELLDKMPELH